MFNLDKFRKNILLNASKLGRADIVKTLVGEGVDVNAKDGDGMTSLMWSAYKCHYDIVEFLLNNGAHVNAKNESGCTALKFADENLYPEISELLKEYEPTKQWDGV